MWPAPSRATAVRLAARVGIAILLATATTIASIATIETVAAGPKTQRRGDSRSQLMDSGTPWIYDGHFVFCRIAFRQSGDGDGNGWWVDYPRADLNFPFRLGELTRTPISHDAHHDANHVVVTLKDPHLFQCPFVMLTEPGGAYFDDEEAANLRKYLDKGGFLWADDFWGEYAWHVWERELRKALPASEFPIIDLPMTHPILSVPYRLREIPQIPSIDYWLRTGRTSEREDSTVPHVRAVENARGHVMVVMTHNTDFGDAFEREGDSRAYFDKFAGVGYAFGVNVYLYAMTH